MLWQLSCIMSTRLQYVSSAQCSQFNCNLLACLLTASRQLACTLSPDPFTVTLQWCWPPRPGHSTTYYTPWHCRKQTQQKSGQIITWVVLGVRGRKIGVFLHTFPLEWWLQFQHCTYMQYKCSQDHPISPITQSPKNKFLNIITT